MNLDQLADEISRVSSDKVAQDLSKLLIDWKNNDETAKELNGKIERYLGNMWIEKNEDQGKIYQMWSLFRDAAISGIDGLTMNERLYYFSLYDRFDACRDNELKLIVYSKLYAEP